MLVIAGQASADPDEAWLTRASTPAGIRPLLIIALDTSAAMTERIQIAAPYDPLTDYAATAEVAGQCDPQRIYWRRGPGPAPDCASMSGLAPGTSTARGGMQCDAAREALARHGYFVAARAAQWHPSGHWEALRADRIEDVECRSDRGRHGREAGQWFATDGPSGPWTGAPTGEIDWDAPPLGEPYIFYTGNFLNYVAAGGRTVAASVMDAIAGFSVAIAATDELDVGVIRTSDGTPDAEGGYVLLAPVSAAAAASRLPTLLADISASGAAPLAEMMTETVAWLSGGVVRYGDNARADSAARDPQNPAQYQSPFLCPCRPVTIAIATAGLPTQDDGAPQVVGNLRGFKELIGGCDGNCLPALTQWMAQSDLREDLPGRQFAALQWIVPSPAPALAIAANDRAGGKIEFAGDPLAFANLMARSLQHDAAVAAGPQLSAAGMLLADDSTHEPAVIYGLSAPQTRERWLGNLLRYRLQPPQSLLAAPVVIGRDGQVAIDSDNGLPKPGSISEWSDQPDGASLLTGGAAGKLPGAAIRRIFSNVTTDVLTSARNQLSVGNPAFSAALLGLGSRDRETPDAVIGWLLNQRLLGDSGLQAPASVNDAGNRTIFFATQDGMLHAIHADTGVERWAFIPSSLLARLPALMRDETTTRRSHGIDGSLILHRFDPNGDGRIDTMAGEHLWLMFGLGRGGSGYYALDIASPDEPRLMWALGPAELGDDAESWASPVISRLSVAGAGQGTGSWVVALAGGYDRAYDFTYLPANSRGASISIRDAATGRRLWRASGNATLLPDLQPPGMTASFASAPRVLDMDGDGYADRLYILDVAGGLWRMDLQNGAAAAGLVRARLLARLGEGGQRFYSSPDISAIRASGGLQLAISLGSGWLARPRDITITDRIYSIRDREQSVAVLHDLDLHDATDGVAAMPAGAPGWFVSLDARAGEKVIGSTLTFDHRLHFLTYQPAVAPLATVCGPPQALRRLRVLDVRSGLPANRLIFPDDPDEHELAGTGLPTAIRFAFPGSWDSACSGCRARPFGFAGGETFDAGFGNDPVKTSWRKLPIEPDSR